jgi:hypothetical protein
VVVVVVVEHWDWDGKIEIQMVTPQRERFNEPNNKIITVFVCVIDLLTCACRTINKRSNFGSKSRVLI